MHNIVLIFIFLCYCPASHALDTTETAGWYVDTYGIAESSPTIERVRQIFDKLKRTSNVALRSTNLVIVNGGNDSWAMALPDGNIVVSIDTISLAYRTADMSLADARIAFILGHELAHQSNRDFWHHLLRISGQKSTIPNWLRNNASRREAHYEKEIKADEYGFINASLAGFRTDKLITAERGRQSFIEYWVEQTGTVNPETHPKASDRSAILRARLAALESKTELFKYGVRLAHFGRFRDARHFLQTFEREYPSREVLNNLGYVHLQLARLLMPERMAYRFWLPTLLENNAGLYRPTDPRSWTDTDELPEAARAELEIARAYLERAVKFDDKDIVSRANLVAVYLYLGKAGTARDLVDEAAAIVPGDAQIMGMRALVLYQQEPGIETWGRANKIFKPLSKTRNVDHNIIYNYGRLLYERGRTGAAMQQWKRLANHLSEIPIEYRRAICRRINTPSCDLFPSVFTRLDKDKFWQLPLKQGEDVDSPRFRKRLSEWRDSKNMQIGTVNTRLLTSNESNTMLALDNKVELATLRSHPFHSSSDLIRKMGNPTARLPLASGEIWSYGGWSALVDANSVREIWISQP